MRSRWFFFTFVFAAAPLAGDESVADSFTVSGAITGHAPDRPIHVALYSSEVDFQHQRYEKSQRFKADEVTADTLRYRFSGVKRGYYMVAAFQDMNQDKVLNKGLFGRPTEPYRLYKPYVGLFRPKFSACEFLVECDVRDADLEF
jgi:uncharacterized protein (DUF2141 family)